MEASVMNLEYLIATIIHEIKSDVWRRGNVDECLCWALHYSITTELRLIFNALVIIATAYIVSQIIFQSIRNLERNCTIKCYGGFCKRPLQESETLSLCKINV